jgi:hypothetical protein
MRTRRSEVVTFEMIASDSFDGNKYVIIKIMFEEEDAKRDEWSSFE